MQALTDTLLPIVNTINGYLSDYILVFLLMEPACTSASRRNSFRYAALEKV